MVYLITGASRGIGWDTAVELSKNADNTVLVISRNEAKLAELSATSENIKTLSYDLTQPNVKQLQEWLSSFDKIDGLVNNAGVLINKPFAELSRADWMTIFETNLFSVVDLIQAILPKLFGGHIINIGSMGGFQGSSKFPGLSAYSASKAALANLTECLAEEFKDKGIAVNCLALGAVQTEMLESAFPGFQAPVDSKQMGAFVAWFLQNGSAFFNGKVLPVSVSTP